MKKELLFSAAILIGLSLAVSPVMAQVDENDAGTVELNPAPSTTPPTQSGTVTQPTSSSSSATSSGVQFQFGNLKAYDNALWDSKTGSFGVGLGDTMNERFISTGSAIGSGSSVGSSLPEMTDEERARYESEVRKEQIMNSNLSEEQKKELIAAEDKRLQQQLQDIAVKKEFNNMVDAEKQRVEELKEAQAALDNQNALYDAAIDQVRNDSSLSEEEKSALIDQIEAQRQLETEGLAEQIAGLEKQTKDPADIQKEIDEKEQYYEDWKKTVEDDPGMSAEERQAYLDDIEQQKQEAMAPLEQEKNQAIIDQAVQQEAALQQAKEAEAAAAAAIEQQKKDWATEKENLQQQAAQEKASLDEKLKTIQESAVSDERKKEMMEAAQKEYDNKMSSINGRIDEISSGEWEAKSFMEKLQSAIGVAESTASGTSSGFDTIASSIKELTNSAAGIERLYEQITGQKIGIAQGANSSLNTLIGDKKSLASAIESLYKGVGNVGTASGTNDLLNALRQASNAAGTIERTVTGKNTYSSQASQIAGQTQSSGLPNILDSLGGLIGSSATETTTQTGAGGYNNTGLTAEQYKAIMGQTGTGTSSTGNTPEYDAMRQQMLELKNDVNFDQSTVVVPPAQQPKS